MGLQQSNRPIGSKFLFIPSRRFPSLQFLVQRTQMLVVPPTVSILAISVQQFESLCQREAEYAVSMCGGSLSVLEGF